MECSINSTKAVCLIDTGSSLNIISSKLAGKLKITDLKPESRKVGMVNGESIELLGTKELSISFARIPGVKYKLMVSVIKAEVKELIIGMKFL